MRWFGWLIALAFVSFLVTNEWLVTSSAAGWFREYRWLPWAFLMAVIATALLRGAAASTSSGTESPPPAVPRPVLAKARAKPVDAAPATVLAPLLVRLPARPSNLVGRVHERTVLTRWCQPSGTPVLVLAGPCGIGKTSLARQWLDESILPAFRDLSAADVPSTPPVEGVLWWTFQTPCARFDQFLEQALTYLGVGVEPGWTPASRVSALVEALGRRRVLIVLDGVESELRSEADRVLPPYQASEDEPKEHLFRDETAVRFLRLFRLHEKMPSKLLIVTDQMPKELDSRTGVTTFSLSGISADDWFEFFRLTRVDAGPTEIYRATQYCEEHALPVQLFARLARKQQLRKGTIEGILQQLEGMRGSHRLNVIQLAFDGLQRDERLLLCRLSSSVGMLTRESIERLGRQAGIADPTRSAQQLADRGWLQPTSEGGLYELHPALRRYAYSRLSDAPTAHATARAEWELAAREPAAARRDFANLVEGYVHAIRAGEFDAAREMFRDRLQRVVLLQSHDYEQSAELLRLLFPKGEKSPPPFAAEGAAHWTWIELAQAYSLGCQPARARAIWVTLANHATAGNHQELLGSALEGQSTEAIHLGRLHEARELSARLSGVWEANRNDVRRAAAERRIGQVFALTGDWNLSARHLRRSTQLAESVGERREIAQCASAWGAHYLWRGMASEAIEASNQALQLFREITSEAHPYWRREELRAHVIHCAARQLVADANPGELEEVHALALDLLERTEELRCIDLESWTLVILARIEERLDQVPSAFDRVQWAQVFADRARHRLLLAIVRLTVAQLLAIRNDGSGANRHAHEAIALAGMDADSGTFHYVAANALSILEHGVRPTLAKKNEFAAPR